ncbi:hypothetical protein [Streptomyces lydicus]|uniref:hypothetical protein n=1 Tax=Streptomyces lydicus TaxID=47763 RepID=UPI00379EDB0D
MFEGADQERVGVVVEHDAVAGEEGAGLPGEGAGDDAPLEAGGMGCGRQGPAGGGPGDLLSGGDAVTQPYCGVGGGEGCFDVEDGVDAAAAAGAVAA